MQSLLRFWPKLVAALLLVAVGFLLYQIAPMEPRWRVTWDEKGMDEPKFSWDMEGQKVRLRWNPRSIGYDLKVLDLNNGKEFARYGAAGLIALLYSPDGRHALHRSGFNEDCWNKDYWIDFATDEQKLLDPREGELENIYPWSFSPGGGYFFIYVWEWQEPKHIQHYLLVFRTGTCELVLERPVSGGTAFVREDQLLYCPKEENPCSIIWDLALGRERARLPFTVGDVVVSPNGSRIVFARDDWELWEISDLSQPQRLCSWKTSWSFGSFSPDGRIWSFWNDENNLEIWNTKSGTRLHELTLSGSGWWHHYFSADSRRLGVLSYEAAHPVFHFVDPWKGKVLWEFPIDLGFNSYDEPLITADSRKVIIYHDDAYHILDAESGRSLARFPHDRFFGHKQLSADHRLLLIPHGIPQDEPERPWLDAVWDYLFPKETYRRPVSVIDMETLETVFALQEHPVPCIYASLSPDGKALLLAGVSQDGECSLTCWDVPGRKPWRWILGFPAALVFLLVIFGGLRRWMRSKPTTALTVAKT
ncbi:MAG: WD40 repeat domain-containing protein [Planctomycetes bacterium]|nr:WD40 repeat domain-containing protein [Planctomycetota bacterium]